MKENHFAGLCFFVANGSLFSRRSNKRAAQCSQRFPVLTSRIHDTQRLHVHVLKNSGGNGVIRIHVASYIPKHSAIFMHRLPALLRISFQPSCVCRFVLARIWNLKRELSKAFEELSRRVAFHDTFHDIPLIFLRPIEHGIVQRLGIFIANPSVSSSLILLHSSRETYR